MSKLVKFVIGIPNSGTEYSKFTVSLFNTCLYMGQLGYQVETSFKESSLIVKSRNELIYEVKEKKSDFLFFIDSDTVFGPSDFDKVMGLNVDIASGLYFNRRSPYLPLVYKKSDDGDIYKMIGYKHDEVPKEPFKCHGVGSGFLLLSKKFINDVTDKDFVEKYGMPFNMIGIKGGDQLGEDLSLCVRANLLGYDVWCNPNTSIGHIGTVVIDSILAKILGVGIDNIYCNDISGWMNFEELNWLYNTAKEMENVVEIGSWKGRSTHSLLCGCPGMVHAIDHFKGTEGDKGHEEAKTVDIEAEFLKNVGKFRNLCYYRQDSISASTNFKDKSVDMVFIDGDHSYDSVVMDINTWLPKCRKIICGHDFNFSSVFQAVSDVLGTVNTYGSIWYKEIN